MKISSLPLRDQIALSTLPGIISADCTHPDAAVSRAYETADIMLAQIQDYQCRIKEAEQKAAKAETALSVLRAQKFDGPDFAPRIALSEIWKLLGAENQTEAMFRLRELLS